MNLLQDGKLPRDTQTLLNKGVLSIQEEEDDFVFGFYLWPCYWQFP